MRSMDLQEIYNSAIEAGQNRDYHSAVKLLTHVVSQTDGFPQALLYLGRSYHALGQFDKAVQVLEFYLKIAPGSEPGHFFLGRTYLALNYPERAIEKLGYVVRINPKFSAALGLLGFAYLKMRKSALAVKYLEKALELDPDNERLFTAYLNALLVKALRLSARKQYEEAESIFLFILKNRNDNILAHIHLARIYRELGNSRGALSHYEQVSRLSPNDPVVPLLKAVIHLQSGDTHSALKELEATPYDPASILSGQGTGVSDNPLITLGADVDPSLLERFFAFSLFRDGRHHESIDFCRRLLRKDYRDADVHGIMAESLMRLNEYEKARNHYLRSVEYSQDVLEYRYGLTLAMWELRDLEGVKKQVNRIRRMQPEDQTARYFAILCQAENNETPRETITELQNMIRRMGPDVNLMSALGRQYLINAMPELSEGWFKRSLDMDEKHRDSYLALIRAYMEMEKKDAAREVYGNYFRVFPRDWSVRREYIRLLISLKDFENASEELFALLSKVPHNRGIKKSLARCYTKMKRFQEAAILYKDLLRDDVDSISLLRSLTYCMGRMDNSASAIELLEGALKYHGERPEILMPLGVLYSRKADYEKAKTIFRQLTALGPKNWKVYHNLAMLYRRTGQEIFAKKFFDTARRYREETKEKK